MEGDGAVKGHTPVLRQVKEGTAPDKTERHDGQQEKHKQVAGAERLGWSHGNPPSQWYGSWQMRNRFCFHCNRKWGEMQENRRKLYKFFTRKERYERVFTFRLGSRDFFKQSFDQILTIMNTYGILIATRHAERKITV
jgi:hypothetical protein